MDGGVATVAVWQSAGMAHQVDDHDRAHRRFRFQDALGQIVHQPNPLPADSREVFAQRIIEQQLAFLIQHQRGDRRHRLGHRRDVEDAVGGHRLTAPRVAVSIGIERDKLVLADDPHHGAGDLPVSDVAVEDTADAREPRRIETDLIRCDDRQRQKRGGGRNRLQIAMGEKEVS